jgi:hypothetical protein
MKKFLPATISSLIFTIYFIWQVSSIYDNNSGKFIYPLDDTYIHLSIAKNIAFSNNFGITSHEFSSSSSSPLYSLLLAFVIYIFGNSDLIPLFINCLASILLFFVLNLIINEKYKILQTSILVFITALLLPICVLAVSGMEHVLQILINLVLFHLFFIIIKDNPTQTLPAMEGLKSNRISSQSEGFRVRSLIKPSLLAGWAWVGLNSNYLILFLFSALTTSIRYEGIFIISLFILIAFLKKDYKLIIGLFISASIPIIIYGVYSTINGSFFFPNSVLLKSSRPKMNIYSLLLYPVSWVYKLYQNPHLLSIFVLVTINLLIKIKNKMKLFDKVNYELLFVISLFIIHLTFARTGWVYRYEAYCVAIGLIVLVRNFNFKFITNKNCESFKNRSFLKTSLSVRVCAGLNCYILLLLIAGIPLIYRVYMSFSETKIMTQNIYQQQYQMAAFLNTYYNDSKIVLNDIGACTYYTNIHLLDLTSLGSIETLKMRISNTFDKEHIYKFTVEKNYEIAILYKEAYKNYIPDKWIETAKLTNPDNIGCAYDNVTFYAVNRNKYNDLKENLIKFRSKLPKDVKLEIF